MSTVVVAGALANKVGSGGEAWVRLSWIRGLQRLGFDVHFVEEITATGCVDAGGRSCHPASSVNLRWFREVMAEFGLTDRATLLVEGDVVVGSSLDDLVAIASSSTLVNISGHLRHPRLLDAFRSRVMVDIDPGFTQFWHALGDPGAGVDGHDLHFTIGENIGTASCPIPTGGIDWRPVRQPVVLDDWPMQLATAPDRFTTIANWRGPFGRVEFEGRSYGLKVHEFRRFWTLPQESPHRFEIALNIHPADRADLDALEGHGWQVVDPSPVTGTPSAFRTYVQQSSAELSVAQGIYVDTACGWFSDRSVRYLASGRPVVVQDTGFGRSLPVGDGLLTFSSLAEAVEATDRVVADHEAHATAARQVAEQWFCSDVVLDRFCDEAGIHH
jgi:hypothetical protein